MSVCMPQIACDCSPQLVTLLRDQRVDVHWIKLSRADTFNDELAVARPLRPVLLHTLPSMGPDPPTPSLIATVTEHLEACGSPHVGVHLSALRNDWAVDVRDGEVVDRVTDIASVWAGALHVPVLVENVTYYRLGSGYLRCVSEPDVIRHVCDRASVGLLLDLAHARVAAWHRGDDVFNYLSALPLDRVREIHVNAPRYDHDCLQDGHLEMREADYSLLEWVLQTSRPRIVTLEYGGTGSNYGRPSDAAAIERQLSRLHRLCGWAS